jgi:hypothetical protein
MHSVPPRRRARVRRTVTVSAVLGLALGGALVAAGPSVASSHREAPLTAGDPKIDNTDVYAFTSPDKHDTVTLIANWLPFEEPDGGPNFYPFQAGAHYDINIDNDGDAKADLTYRWTFTDVDTRGANTFLANNGRVTALNDPNLLFKQTYTLKKIVDGDEAGATTVASGTAAPSFAGKASMPKYSRLRNMAKTPVTGGGMSFAGQADDSFFLDLRVFDLLYGANLKEAGHDTLAGYNVNSIALQVPKTEVAQGQDAGTNPVIGVWSSTEKQTMQLTAGAATPTGPFVQVSRLGNPLVNEVVVPAGLKDAFNSITPDVDHTVTPVVNKVLNPELPQLIQGIYGVPAPATPRNDLVEIFLTGIAKKAPTLDGSTPPIQADLNSQVLNGDVDATKFVPSEMLRLNMAVPVAGKPNRLGVLAQDFQGFPNGRRLTDDVVDIAIQAVEGAAQTGKLVPALAAGDAVNANDHAFGATFPYVAFPNARAVNANSGVLPPAGPVGGDEGPGRFLPTPVLLPVAVAALLLLLGGAAVAARARRLPSGLLPA